ncbi:hypothetical protein CNX70_14195 [Janthinobacterium svalbardensis]|uniref:Uncharacterized protein n=2 Tax=Janthinobacterium svalbardensis TaxID=368607 RepID=A0A290WWA6_9BURK|nr:hypothetical protein CNX70_14195 [Janthinobacterium svalbardensis]
MTVPAGNQSAPCAKPGAAQRDAVARGQLGAHFGQRGRSRRAICHLFRHRFGAVRVVARQGRAAQDAQQLRLHAADISAIISTVRMHGIDGVQGDGNAFWWEWRRGRSIAGRQLDDGGIRRWKMGLQAPGHRQWQARRLLHRVRVGYEAAVVNAIAALSRA